MVFRTLDNVLDQDNKPVRKLALCKVYQTIEEASKDGIQVTYDPNKPIKSWFMPKNLVTPDEEDMAQFLGVGLAKDHKTPLTSGGKPFGKPFKVPFEDVDKLNIPFKKSGKPDEPGVGWEYQQPLTVLQEGEFWDWIGFGLPCVRKLTQGVAKPGPVTGDLSAIVTKLADLTKISDKLDVLEAKIDALGGLFGAGRL